MGAEFEHKHIALWQPDNVPARWHMYVNTHACWIPAWPKPDSDREAIKLLKQFNFHRYNIEMPSHEKPEFTGDFWLDNMEDDMNLFRVFEYCHKRFNANEYSAQLTLEDSANGEDPAWEFPIAYYKSSDMFSSTGFAHFKRAHISYDETYTIFNSTPRDGLYFTGCAILLCRMNEVRPGGLAHSCRGTVEDWNAYLQK